ncbi:WxL domain-containing protein [Streptomyces sp. G-G2]|uniref:WxL domain-containing protein n=1 Tax=Streptomyces sp. G-G2 TaxID=3046201 RepID=UPI0024BAF103|nr:WxL domain-containing protein [Streptomyces sp. G-G2]MDJ0382009.1 WxL domain-containing protein [Streptomyces sp. G-G2]
MLLVLGCGAAAQALPASGTGPAGTITPTVHCVLPAGQGEATGAQQMTVELTPATVAPGGKVHAKVTLGPSPATSAVSITQVPTTPSIDLAMSGGASGTATVTGPEIPVDIIAGEHIVIPPYEGDFLVPLTATGPVAFTPLRTLTRTKVFGGAYETPCVVTAGGASVGTVDVQGSGGPPAVLGAPSDPVRPNTAVTLTGSGWTVGGTAQPSLCDTGGAGCDTAKFAASALVIDSSGGLSGTATLAPATQVPDGDYLVKVNDGAKEATAPLTVRAVAAGERKLTLSASSGPVGTVITVSGANYRPDQWINVVGLNSDGVTLDDTAVYPKSGSDGAFSTEFTVSDPTLASVQADEGGDPATVRTQPFTVTTGGGGVGGSQKMNLSVLPGPLTMSQAGDSVDFGSVSLDGSPHTLNGALNKVTVHDARGINTGWSLTGTMSDFTTAAGASLPAGMVSWAPACAAQAGSSATPVAGSPARLGTAPAALCSVATDGSRASIGGNFDADAALTLQLPGTAQPGSYTAVLTLSLS